MTAHDLALWNIALYSDVPLSAAIRNAMWTPVNRNNGSSAPYGFGWQLAPQNGHRTIEHSGHWHGFSSQITRSVDDHLTVIVLTNLNSANLTRIAHHVAGQYEPALMP